MAQAKVVDYDLLAAAGKASSPVISEALNKATKSSFTKFLEVGEEFLTFQMAKTDELIAATPEVDISKVDDGMLDVTNEFLRKQREIIARTSHIMTWHGSRTQKGRDAIDEYNQATSNIVNFNKNLTKIATDRKYNLENRTYDGASNVFRKIDAEELANGELYKRIQIHDNGDMWFMSTDNLGLEPGTHQVWVKDMKHPGIYDSTVNDGYNAILEGIINQRTDTEPLRYLPGPDGIVGGANAADDILNPEYRGIAQFNTAPEINKMLINANTTQLKSFLYTDRDKNNESWIKRFLTEGNGTWDKQTNTFTDGSVDEFGLGLTENSPEYQAAFIALQETIDPDVMEELRGFLFATMERDFDAYKGVKKEDKVDTRTDNRKSKNDVFTAKIKTINRMSLSHESYFEMTKPGKNRAGDVVDLTVKYIWLEDGQDFTYWKNTGTEINPIYVSTTETVSGSGYRELILDVPRRKYAFADWLGWGIDDVAASDKDELKRTLFGDEETRKIKYLVK